MPSDFEDAAIDDAAEVKHRLEAMMPWLKGKGMAQFLEAGGFICVADSDRSSASERGYIFKLKLRGVHLCLISPAGNAAPFFCFEDFEFLKMSEELGSRSRLRELVGL